MSGQQFADPNREAVGLEPAWAEGNGGSDTSAGGGPPANGLDDMTKDELLQVADQRGLEVNASMTKAEIREVIDREAGG